MKRILVPTDFSPAADNALAYAAELAKAFAAELAIVHIYMVPVEPEMTGALDRIVYDNAEELIKNRAQGLREQGLDVLTEIRAGAASAGLRHYLSEHEVDLVVMGCQGEQAIPARFIGSTTTSLIDLVQVPILAVPDQFPAGLPKKIVWATDRTPPTERATLAPMLQLLEHSKGSLSVFHLEEDADRLPPDPGFSRLLGDIDYDFWHQADDDQEPLEEAINDFVRTMDADLLVMLHRRQGWFARLFKLSTSRLEVWSAPVPVLILQHE